MDSLLCEEFDCLPSQLDGESPRRLLRIVELRNYARAVDAVEAHAAAVRDGRAKPDDLPVGPMIDLVFELQGMKIEEDELDHNG